MATWTTSDIEVQASASNAAGATATSSWIDLITAAGGLVCCKITNGGTAPTIACSASVDLSPDNGTTAYNDFAVGTAGLVISAVYNFFVDVPPGTRYLRTRFTGNTGQAVTVQADFQKLTSFG